MKGWESFLAGLPSAQTPAARLYRCQKPFRTHRYVVYLLFVAGLWQLWCSFLLHFAPILGSDVFLARRALRFAATRSLALAPRLSLQSPVLQQAAKSWRHRCGQPGSAIIRDKKRINPWPELFGSSALHFRLLWSAHCHCRTYLAPQVLDLIKHGQIGLRCDDELGPHAPGCLTCACRGFGLPWLWLFSQVGPETVRHRAFEAPSCHLTSSWQSVVMLHQAIRAVQDTMLHANLYLAPRIMNVLSSTSRAEPYLNAVARGRRPHPEIFRTSKLKTRIFNL